MTGSPSDTMLIVPFPSLPKKSYFIRITGRRNIADLYTLKIKRCYKWFSESGKRFASKFVKTNSTSERFSNWKNPRKLATDETTGMHKEAVTAHAIFIGQSEGIDVVLLSKQDQKKVVGREAIKVIFDASKTMVRKQ